MSKKKKTKNKKDKLSKKEKKFVLELLKDIEKHGRRIVGVASDEDNPTTFFYSVGNSLYGIPELISFYPSDSSSCKVINEISDAMLEDEIIVDKEYDMVLVNGMFGDDVRVELRYIDPDSIQYDEIKNQYALITSWMDNPEFVQVVIADPNNRFPHERGVMPEVKANTPRLMF